MKNLVLSRDNLNRLFSLFLVGIIFLFIVNAIELLSYNLSNEYSIPIYNLFPVFLMTFTLYLLFSLIFIIPAFFVIQVSDRVLSQKSGKLKKFLENRSYHIWTLVLLIFVFISIKISNLDTGKTFYFALIMTFVLFFIFFNKKAAPYITASVFLVVFGIYFYFLYDINSAISKLQIKDTSKGKKPNVLLLVADTTRQDHLSFYNYKRKTSPHLDALAKNGVVYENTFSTSSWTRPSTAALITSKYLSDDAIHTHPLPIGWDGIQMAQYFQAKSYNTALFSANDNLSAYSNMSKGFDHTVYTIPPFRIHFFRFISMKLFYMAFNKKTALYLANRYSTKLVSLILRDLVLEKKEIPDFLSGKIDTKRNLSARDKQIYKNVLGAYAEQLKQIDNLENTYNLMQNSIFTPFLTYVYEKILYIYFFPNSTTGEMVDKWMMDKDVSDSFINWMENNYNKEKPFFVHLQYMGPHTPYVFQEPYVIPEFDADFKKPVFMPPPKIFPPSVGGEKAPEDVHNNLIANYDNSIRAMDANIQSVIDYLQKKGYLENTIIVFLADHGEAFYEHKNYHHQGSLHYELVNIPLLFYWQNKLIPDRLIRPSAMVDIFPSLVTLTGNSEDLPKLNFDGESLFDENITPRKDKRENFLVKLSVEIEDAMSKPKPAEPYGVYGAHTAVITQNGKVIRESEKTGLKYYYFPYGDMVEDRSKAEIDPKNPNLPDSIRKMIEELPPPVKSFSHP